MGKRKPNEGNEKLSRYTTWYAEDRESYRQFAEAKRQQTRFTQEYLSTILDRGRYYILQQMEERQPLTIAGMQIACGCNKMDFSRMRSGEYDWRAYQLRDYRNIREEDIDIHWDELLNLDLLYWTDPGTGEYILLNPYSEIIDRFYLLLQSQLEQQLYTKDPKGAIFLLKAIFHWSDKPQGYKARIAPVHIATKEEALNALNEWNKPKNQEP